MVWWIGESHSGTGQSNILFFKFSEFCSSSKQLQDLILLAAISVQPEAMVKASLFYLVFCDFFFQMKAQSYVPVSSRLHYCNVSNGRWTGIWLGPLNNVKLKARWDLMYESTHAWLEVQLWGLSIRSHCTMLLSSSCTRKWKDWLFALPPLGAPASWLELSAGAAHGASSTWTLRSGDETPSCAAVGSPAVSSHQLPDTCTHGALLQLGALISWVVLPASSAHRSLEGHQCAPEAGNTGHVFS